MKKSLLLILVLFLLISAYAQSNSPQQLATTAIPNKDAKFLLFPTQNIHIFLKLNTRTGEIYMVQFSTKNEQTEIKLDSFLYPLVEKYEESNGRFYLYPTTNIYNFILLDQIDGRVWQVQWHTDKDSRIILRILGDIEYHNYKDGVLISDLECIDGVHYLNGKFFYGEAFVNKEKLLAKSYYDGREKYDGDYFVYHKNGLVAFICKVDKIDNVLLYYDENNKRIAKEEFETKYPGMIQKVKDTLTNFRVNKSGKIVNGKKNINSSVQRTRPK